MTDEILASTDQPTYSVDDDLTYRAPVSEAVPVDFDLDAWIDGGTVHQRSVVIHAGGDIGAQFQDWERRYDRALEVAKASGGDEPLADAQVEALEQEGKDILERFEATKSTWYLRALDLETEIKPVRDAAEEFEDLPPFREKEPVAPRDHANGKPNAGYVTAYNAWAERRDAYIRSQKPEQEALDAKRAAVQDAINLDLIATSVVKIESATGAVAHGVTVDQLKRIRTRIGPLQVASLLNAATLATYTEPSLSIPFSHSTSRDDQG